tara:strand:+ start:234 stop:1040 length:807 start_codon:yes stop_codon:yes gene_type:complete
MTLILHGDCQEQLKNIEDETVDAIITDPPYGISFMGNKWDYDVPSIKLWKESKRVLKKGGYLLSFSSAKTYHRLVCNVEDAGFEIRDQILWIYGEGMPKSKSLLKPAHEPIVMAIKPGALQKLNIDKSRIGTEKRINSGFNGKRNIYAPANKIKAIECIGRYPANLLHDGNTGIEQFTNYFYCAKADVNDRNKYNTHPTVKPVKLMEYLIRLVCNKGSLILDPFMGSGTTGKAALQQGMDFIGIEQNAKYIKIAKKRLNKVAYQQDLF